MHHTISKSVMEFVNQNNQEVDENATLLDTGCRFADETVNTHPNFAGLSLDIPQWEKIELLSRINNLISKWVPHFANLEGVKFTPTPREDNKIIRLNNSEHCVLFKFFYNNDNISNLYQDSVKNMYYLYESNNEPESARGFFALCKSTPSDIITHGRVNFKYGYLIYVPGIVMGMTIEIVNEFLSFPAADCVVDSQGSFELNNDDMIALLDRIKTGLIIQENYLPHITLGTSVDYKPAITEQIVNSLYQFLQVLKDKAGDEFMVYSADENGSVSQVVPNYLFDVMNLQRTDPVEDPQQFTQLVFASCNKLFQKNLQDVNFTYNPKQESQLNFSNTKVMVSGDISLIFLKDLPLTNDFTIDAYLMPIGGDLKPGQIKIFS